MSLCSPHICSNCRFQETWALSFNFPKYFPILVALEGSTLRLLILRLVLISIMSGERKRTFHRFVDLYPQVVTLGLDVLICQKVNPFLAPKTIFRYREHTLQDDGHLHKGPSCIELLGTEIDLTTNQCH